MADYINYKLDLGTFEGENFKWKTLKTFNSWEKAYSAYKKFINEQMSYTDDELYEVWHSTRLDVELKENDKLINWVGIYLRKKDNKENDEDDEDTTKDSLFGPRL